MDADKLRELIARREGPALDFKRAQFDWDGDEGNNELAKDLSAMANGLQPGCVGYLLIGVEEQADKTGRAIGVPLSAHLDDADMQKKARGTLNKQPAFNYYAIDLDGLSIGVFEVRSGGRPFFPLRDKGTKHRLFRHVAFVRVGTSTDIASPEQIQEWAHEDDPSLHELRRVQIEREEAALVVCPAFTIAWILSQQENNPSGMLEMELLVGNNGPTHFRVTAVRSTWNIGSHFVERFVKKADRRTTIPYGHCFELEYPELIAPGQKDQSVKVAIPFGPLFLDLQRQLPSLNLAASGTPPWLLGTVTVEATGVTGRIGAQAQLTGLLRTSAT